MATATYTNGEYLLRNPTWHSEDSPFKAQQILKMIARRGLEPQTICEIGCGAGGILSALHDAMPATCSFEGYELSPQAITLAAANQRPRVAFHCEGIPRPNTRSYDLVLVMDVVEHVEDYFAFLRQIKLLGGLIMFHIPLDITLQGIVRKSLSRGWDDVGHIHAFTKDVALRALRHCGYEIIDHFYTNRSEIAFNNWKLRAAGIPRRMAFAVHKDLAVRVLGGYSVLVLAQ
jgi:Methyltransferase domain